MTAFLSFVLGLILGCALGVFLGVCLCVWGEAQKKARGEQ